MSRVKILIVDDSVVFRSQIRAALDSVAWAEVVAVAANGRVALEMLAQYQPDAMILDIEMPELNGLETLREMKKRGLSTKTIVFSSVSLTGARGALEALELGAIDFVAKPGQDGSSLAGARLQALRETLVAKIAQLFTDRVGEPRALGSSRPIGDANSTFDWLKFRPQSVVIGSSTGGPTALEKIFSQLRGPTRCPIFIVQHMPPIFTASLAERLERLCGIPAAEPVDGEVVKTNRIYMAPGNFHMRIESKGLETVVRINQEEPENSVRPAVDQLFRSAAELFRADCLGIVLTGMGRDGLSGAKMLREKANPMIIQSKESCVVFGMPGALYENGEFDAIQNLDEVAETLRFYCAPQNERRVG
jgi:two-component system chemotaxis response regulator CheB